MSDYPAIWLDGTLPATVNKIIISKYLIQNGFKNILIDCKSGRGVVIDAIPEQ